MSQIPSRDTQLAPCSHRPFLQLLHGPWPLSGSWGSPEPVVIWGALLPRRPDNPCSCGGGWGACTCRGSLLLSLLRGVSVPGQEAGISGPQVEATLLNSSHCVTPSQVMGRPPLVRKQPAHFPSGCADSQSRTWTAQRSASHILGCAPAPGRAGGRVGIGPGSGRPRCPPWGSNDASQAAALHLCTPTRAGRATRRRRHSQRHPR